MLFLMNEFSAMLPRAISTHKWYRKTFSTYPPERKVVIPGIF
jgi:3-oxo-5-alpha-steroid 4-dehydrogenase 1